MVGRNDPCPCGSGKKYKKCCLAKDRAARAQRVTAEKSLQIPAEAEVPADFFEPEPILKHIPEGDLSPTPEVDPLLERINAFWKRFMDAPYEKQWVMTTKMLAEEPELCDGEMVFEITNTLFAPAVAAAETERFKQLLDQLEEIVPEAYNEELSYILEWRTQIALIEGDEAGLERYFYEFSPLAGDQLDTYYRIINALTYHGKLEILYEGMRQARSCVAGGGDLVPWAYGEFTEKLGDLEVLQLLNQDPALRPDDPTLEQRFAEYELTIEHDIFSTILDYRTGRQTPSWTIADIRIPKGKKKHPAQDRYACLLAAFTHYACHVEGVSLTKAEMARDELDRYLIQRRQGELDETGDDYGRRSKRRRKRKTKHGVTQHPLCPDAQTLDKYMAQLMGFMSFQYYKAFALFELIPTWLRFLTKYDILDEENEQQTVQALSYLKGYLIQIADNHLSDPAVKENLMEWPYE